MLDLDVGKLLRERYPHGHREFIPIALDAVTLHSRKNHDYAGGGDPLGNFKRRSAIMAQYPDLDLGDPRVIPLLDILKQLDAALWMLNTGFTPKVESLEDRLRDILVYAGIAICIVRDHGPAKVE